MSIDEDLAKIVGSDQSSAAIKTLTQAVAAFYHGLRERSIPEPAALEMTKAWITSLGK